jgi:HlyD family secretion protein
MTATTRRRLLLAAGLAVVAAAVALLLRPAAVTAEAASADTGPVRVTVDWTGKTRVRDRYAVAAPVTGALLRPAVRAGDPVKAGDVLARVAGAASSPLDPRTRAELEARLEAARAAAAQAAAALSAAEAASALAAADAARAEAVGTGGGLSAQALETARAQARVREEEQRVAEGAARRAGAEVAAARAALQVREGTGAVVEVKAPAAGVVLRVLKESAGPVAAGTPLVEVGDPSRLEVVLDLPTADAVRVRPGQPARIGGFGGAGALEAVVRLVEPSAYTKVSPLGVEEQRVDVLLDPVGPGWEALGDGFSVDAQVIVEEVKDAVRVPSSALFRRGGGWALYAVEDGRARQRGVEVAARGDGSAAIRDGVKPGDRVLLHPGDEVKDGVRVTLR